MKITVKRKESANIDYKKQKNIFVETQMVCILFDLIVYNGYDNLKTFG